MADHAAHVRHDGGGVPHGHDHVRVRHRRDQDLSPLEAEGLLDVEHQVHLSGADAAARGNAGQDRTRVRSEVHRFGRAERGGDGPGLHHVDGAALDAPLDVLGAPEVGLQRFGQRRQLGGMPSEKSLIGRCLLRRRRPQLDPQPVGRDLSLHQLLAAAYDVFDQDLLVARRAGEAGEHHARPLGFQESLHNHGHLGEGLKAPLPGVAQCPRREGGGPHLPDGALQILGTIDGDGFEDPGERQPG